MVPNPDMNVSTGRTAAGARQQSNAAVIDRYNRTFTDTVLACATLYMQTARNSAYASKRGEHYKALERFLKKGLTAQATLHETLYSGWISDRDNPGYLIKQVPPSFFRVPFHLVAVFPDDDVLEQVWSLANRIRTDPDGIIFISGSNAVGNVLDYVGDVDFCEYMPKFGGEANEAIWAKLHSLVDDVCIRLRVGTEEWATPFPKEDVSRSFQATSYSAPERSHAKVDYISRNVGTRVMDVSNVLILCSKEFQSVAFANTFSFQEAQVSAIDYVPNPLANILELGRYVCFLVKEINKYNTHGNHAKALKRALSLTRVTCMNDFTTRIKGMFDHSTLLIDGEISTCGAIKRSLEQHCPTWVNEIAQLERHLKWKQSERPGLLDKEGDHFATGIHSAAENILREVLTAVALRSGGAVK
jgi:hypothetical protein